MVTPWVVGFIAAHARRPRSAVRRPGARFLLVRAGDLEVVLPDDDTLAAVVYLQDMATSITNLARRVWPLIRRYGFDALVVLAGPEAPPRPPYGGNDNQKPPTRTLG